MPISRLAAFSALFLLSACALSHPPREARYWQEPKNAHVIPQQSEYTVHLSTRDALPPEEAQGLARFLGETGTDGFGSVTLSTDAGANARRALTRVLRAHGYASTDIAILPPRAGQEERSAIVTVDSATLALPECPNWSDSAIENSENGLHSNFGCASARDFGLMLADPRDMERGAGTGRPDSQRNDIVIESYHTGQVALPTTQNASGTGAMTQGTSATTTNSAPSGMGK